MSTKRDLNKIFHLRFYNQTEDAVEECVCLLKKANPAILRHTYEAPRNSVNWHSCPSHEVHLHFNTRAEAEAMSANETTKEIYLRYAHPTKADLKLRVTRPGDQVFGHH